MIYQKSILAPAMDGQKGSFLGQEDSSSAADAITGTGDDGDFSSEAAGHCNEGNLPSHGVYISRLGRGKIGRVESTELEERQTRPR